jgi:hypothetical protein
MLMLEFLSSRSCIATDDIHAMTYDSNMVDSHDAHKEVGFDATSRAQPYAR